MSLNNRTGRTFRASGLSDLSFRSRTKTGPNPYLKAHQSPQAGGYTRTPKKRAAPSMKDLADLTARELERAKKHADTAVSRLVEEMIQAGRGHETMLETFQKKDPLSLRYKTAHLQYQDIVAEERRRKEYHGSLNKIKTNKAFKPDNQPVQTNLF